MQFPSAHSRAIDNAVSIPIGRQEIILVVTNDPASIADAYATMRRFGQRITQPSVLLLRPWPRH